MPLHSYGPNFGDVFPQVGRVRGQDPEGAKPGDLPNEQPTQFAFVVNLKSAKSLGTVIPESILLGAAEVIK